MTSIAHLPLQDQQHFTLCPVCTEWFDMRDLSDVFNHLHLSAKLQAEWSGSRQKGSREWFPNRNVCTNPRLHKRIDTGLLRRLNHNLKKYYHP